MLNSLCGKITYKISDILRLETAGIEWELSIPSVDAGLFAPVGQEARVLVWLLHREDQMKLFGFPSESRRLTFLELLKVDGIGPRQAIKIMGGIDQESLERALDSDDLGRLEAVPGLGKKTAQKMLLSLKGRLVRNSIPAKEFSEHEELIQALGDMGFDKKAASAAIGDIQHQFATELDVLSPVEREKLIFRQAIILLSGTKG